MSRPRCLWWCLPGDRLVNAWGVQTLNLTANRARAHIHLPRPARHQGTRQTLSVGPANWFVDADGDVVTHTLTLADGSLAQLDEPGWPDGPADRGRTHASSRHLGASLARISDGKALAWNSSGPCASMRNFRAAAA